VSNVISIKFFYQVSRGLDTAGLNFWHPRKKEGVGKLGRSKLGLGNVGLGKLGSGKVGRWLVQRR